MLAMLVFLWRATRVPQRTLLALAASSFLFTALAVCAGNAGFASSWYCAGAENLSACWFEMATESLQPFRRAALGLVVAALLGFSLALRSAVRSARAQSDGSKRASRVSTALLLAGAAAFWLTRAEHADTANLIPPDPDHIQKAWISQRLQDQLPPAKPGCVAIAGPTVELAPDGVMIDGTRMGTPEDLTRCARQQARAVGAAQPRPKVPRSRLARSAAHLEGRRDSVVAAGRESSGLPEARSDVEGSHRRVADADGRVAREEAPCVEVRPIDRVEESAIARFETWGDLVALP